MEFVESRWQAFAIAGLLLVLGAALGAYGLFGGHTLQLLEGAIGVLVGALLVARLVARGPLRIRVEDDALMVAGKRYQWIDVRIAHLWARESGKPISPTVILTLPDAILHLTPSRWPALKELHAAISKRTRR